MRSALMPLLNKLSLTHSNNGCAISFYFFPQKPPQNKAHAEDRILLKDLIKEAKTKAEDQRRRHALADLNRIGDFVDRFAQNGTEPTAIFACAEHDIWEVVPLPGTKGRTRIDVNGRFHLRPLAEAEAQNRTLLVALADRIKVRFVRYQYDDLDQFDAIESDLPRKARTDGFGGYDAGHKERHVGHWEMYHFKEMADKLKQLCENGSFDAVVIVCRSEIRPEIEPHLHPYVTERLLGFIDQDPAMLSQDNLKNEIGALDSERQRSEEEALVREVIGEAQRNSRGSLGLRDVLVSIERGEVQTLVIGEGFSATITECTNCGHLNTRNGTTCALCSQPVREVDDIVDALTTRALRSSMELRFINDDDFRRAGNIGALLRFRADQNTPAKLAS
jgi:peptide chain release factor subunit 1